MERFLLAVFLVLLNDGSNTFAAPPSWHDGPVEDVQISMMDSSACDNGVALVSATTGDGTTVSYSFQSGNTYGFTIVYDNTDFDYYLHCDLATLQALDDSVQSFSLDIRADNSGETADKTYAITLVDKFAPVFANTPLSFDISKCDLADGTYSNGDVLHTIDVSDNDLGDSVTVTITSVSTPFTISGQKSIALADIDALKTHFDTQNDYQFSIQAADNGNKHTTSNQVTINLDDSCENGDDDDGVINLSSNIYLLLFVLLLSVVIQALV